MSAAVAGETTIAAIHPDVLQSHILNRLDGPALASTSCASAQVLSLCNDDRLWKHICNSTWPSTADHRVRRAISAFPAGHTSFFSDSFPARRHLHFTNHDAQPPQASELISAVDIFFDGRVIFSKVLETETLSPWFLCTPFRLDLLDPKETVPTPLDLNSSASIQRAADRFKISWILIDPSNKRAINVASETAVEVHRHWLTDDVQLRFATVVAGRRAGELVQCGVLVTFSGRRVKEINMQVEEMEGKIVTGKEGLAAVQAAMEGHKWKRDGDREKDIYKAFTRMKAQFRERKQKREKGVDMACIATGVSAFIAVLVWIISLWG